jgi:hypothetical protein
MSPSGSHTQSSPAQHSSSSAGELAAEQLRTSSRKCDCRDGSPLLATGPSNGVRSAAATPPVHPSRTSGAPSCYAAAARSRLVVGSCTFTARRRQDRRCRVTALGVAWQGRVRDIPAALRARSVTLLAVRAAGPGTRPGRCVGGGQDAGPRRQARGMGGRGDHRVERSPGGLLADTAQLGAHRAARRGARET